MYAVTGVTGKVGGAVARTLLEAGAHASSSFIDLMMPSQLR